MNCVLTFQGRSLSRLPPRVRSLRLSRSHHFAWRKDNGDFISYRNFISRGSRDICQNPSRPAFDLHRGLIGFDLHQRLALGHRLAFGLQPIKQRSFFLRDSQRRHDHIRRHINSS